MKVYLIFVSYKWGKETNFDKPIVLYGVANEMQARKDCIKLQTRFNESNHLMKAIYYYKEVKIYQ